MNKRLYFLLTVCALFSLSLLAGCGMRALLTSQLLPDNDWPKKRIMVMPPVDLTGIALHESLDTIHEELTTILQKTGFFNLYPHNKKKKSYSFTPGDPIDPELLREAKRERHERHYF